MFFKLFSFESQGTAVSPFGRYVGPFGFGLSPFGREIPLGGALHDPWRT